MQYSNRPVFRIENSPPFTPEKWRQEEKSQRWEEEGHFPRHAAADQDIGGNPHGKNRQIHQQSPVENHRQEGANRIEVFPHLCKQLIIYWEIGQTNLSNRTSNKNRIKSKEKNQKS